MKKLAALVAFVFCNQSIAGVADIAPSEDRLGLSSIQSVVTLQEETKGVAIRLVKVDNGGSSDVSSLMAPSRLYLTFHADGEMYDIDGSYEVASAVISFKVLKVDLKNGIVDISYKLRNDQMDLIRQKARLHFKGVLNEIAEFTNSDDSTEGNLTSSVGWQNLNP